MFLGCVRGVTCAAQVGLLLGHRRGGVKVLETASGTAIMSQNPPVAHFYTKWDHLPILGVQVKVYFTSFILQTHYGMAGQPSEKVTERTRFDDSKIRVSDREIAEAEDPYAWYMTAEELSELMANAHVKAAAHKKASMLFSYTILCTLI